jgi:class 3 adenylate cyclase
MNKKKWSLNIGILLFCYVSLHLFFYLSLPVVNADFSISVSPTQVVLSSVGKNTKSWELGLRPGNIITRVNQVSSEQIISAKYDKTLRKSFTILPHLFSYDLAISLERVDGFSTVVPINKISFYHRIQNIPFSFFSMILISLTCFGVGFILWSCHLSSKQYFYSFLCFLLGFIFINIGVPIFSSLAFIKLSRFNLDIGMFSLSFFFLYIISKQSTKKTLVLFPIVPFGILLVIKYSFIAQHIIDWYDSFFYYLVNYCFIGILSYSFFLLLVHAIGNDTKNTVGSTQQNELSTELDMLEKTLLECIDATTVFNEAGDWIINRIHASCIAFGIKNDTENLSVQYFNGDKSFRKELELLTKEMQNSSFDSSLFRGSNKTYAVPFYKENTIAGFLLIGPSKRDTGYSKDEITVILPFVRILSKTLLFIEAVQFKKEKNQLQFAFSRYISPDMVNKIMNNPEVMHLGGEKQVLTAIFTDLRGFTSLSDSMDPVVLVRVLNMYLNEMSEVIISLGGTIDKFEGDAIMAFFGAPTPFSDHAKRACTAALRMKKMEQILNEQLIREGVLTQPLFTRIGINSGEMIVGNIGSMQRLDYTIIGSNVNIAARLENKNKEYGTSILISDQTMRIVKDQFETRFVDAPFLKGLSKPIPVFELISEKFSDDIERMDLQSQVASLMTLNDAPIEELEEVK